MKGQLLAAAHDVDLVQAVKGPDQPQAAAHRLVQEAFEIAKERRRAVGERV